VLAAALDGAIVEVDRVVAQAELPHAAGGVVRKSGGRHAALVTPGLATQVPQAAQVPTAGVEVGGSAASGALGHVFALHFERAIDPHALQSVGAVLPGTGQGAGIDQPHGSQVGVGPGAPALLVGTGVVVEGRHAEMQDPAAGLHRRVVEAAAEAIAVAQIAGQLTAEGAGQKPPIAVVAAVADRGAPRDAEGVGGHRLGNEVVVPGAG